MIVGQTERLSRCYPTTILVAGMLVVCSWISPVADAGPNLSKENFSEATPTPAAQYLASGDSVGSTSYGGMVVAGSLRY